MLTHFLRTVNGPPSITFGSGATNVTTAQTYTFSGMSIGTANPRRFVVVTFLYRIAATFVADPTVTVAGQSCTLLTAAGNTGNPHARQVVYITDSPVTTGTTADVFIDANGTQSLTRAFIASYAVTSSSPLVSTQTDNTGATVPAVVTINSNVTRPTQVGIFAAGAGTNGSLTSFTVSGPLSTDYDTGLVSSTSGMISATVTGTGNCTATTTGTNSTNRAILVAWS